MKDLLPFGQHYKYFSPPTPPSERVGGHCKLAFLLLVVLFSITDLDMYLQRKIFQPSEVLEVSPVFFMGENPPSMSVGNPGWWESDME